MCLLETRSVWTHLTSLQGLHCRHHQAAFLGFPLGSALCSAGSRESFKQKAGGRPGTGEGGRQVRVEGMCPLSPEAPSSPASSSPLPSPSPSAQVVYPTNRKGRGWRWLCLFSDLSLTAVRLHLPHLASRLCSSHLSSDQTPLHGISEPVMTS